MSGNTGNSAPLWLKIKTEYIDENLDEVIRYLRGGVGNAGDSFYALTVDLLEQRIEELFLKMDEVPFCAEADAEETIWLQIHMLGAFILVHHPEDRKKRHAFALMARLLMQLEPDLTDQLVSLVIENLVGKLDLGVGSLMFGWEDMLKEASQVLGYKLINGAKYHDRIEGESWKERAGTLCVRNGQLELYAVNRDQCRAQDMVGSMHIADRKLTFFTTKDYMLKASCSSDMESIEEFTKNFRIDLDNYVPSASHMRKDYAQGNRMKVEVTSIDWEGISVRTVDPKYNELSGKLVMRKRSNLCYPLQDFKRYLKMGNVVMAELEDLDALEFSISQTFSEFVLKYYLKVNIEVPARITSVQTDRSAHRNRKAYMITEDGFSVQAYCPEIYDVGDDVLLNVASHGQGQYWDVVMCEILDRVDSSEFGDEAELKQEIISDFCEVPVPQQQESEIVELEPIEDGELKELCRMLVPYQQMLVSPSERYTVLCALQLLAKMMGWKIDYDYVDLLAEYLENLVLFAKGKYDKIRTLEIPECFQNVVALERRAHIVSILKCYGQTDKDVYLTEAAADAEPLVRKLAVLVRSSNCIGSYISPSMLNMLKRSIVTSLSVDEACGSELEAESGAYVGIEDEHQEFKTSFFFAPKDAKEQDQKQTIFKGVCAFLNSQEGGTLYLGVNDSGYVSGIDTDLEHLERAALGNYHGIDGYIRYITDEAKKHFDLAVQVHISIKAMYDNRVVALSVKPYLGGVVKLGDTAYVRLNNESVRMTAAAERKISADRKRLYQNGTESLELLLQAINGKHKAILHGYSSSHSGTVRDRHVEPFSLCNGDSAVQCFDEDAGICKQFKLERISNVEVLEAQWTHQSQHHMNRTDIFGMSGDQTIHVKLQLNLRAKNLLVEEYPQADKELIPTNDPDCWSLETDVCHLEGVGRFYIGLANCITLIDTPELKKYAEDFIKENLR